ncbi:Zinc finger protein [Pseudolycoriella hygida]|uniref:Zinc finger protein n=1 Tax=Pseudolycoriella hygida TaxID=35572 RepID=A0A9Q0MYK6_9DIPT|nr:Zinc finger protein [Pseudolycoriella hygida]
MTKILNFPNEMCRVCEFVGQTTDLSRAINKSMLRKLRAVADISFDIDDQLPKGLCQKCCENLDRAYKFKIQCEYTEQKLRDALAACQLEHLDESVSSIEERGDGDCSINQNELKTDCDDNADVLEDCVVSVQSQDCDLYETSSMKEDRLVEAEVESQTSAMNSQIIDVGVDSEVNIDYGDVERLDDDEQYGDMGEVLEGEIGEFTPIEYIYDDSDIEFLDHEDDVDHGSNKIEDWKKMEKNAKTKPSKANSRDPEANKFHCDTCGAAFKKYADLNEHKKTHGNKRYQCPTCSRWFSKKYHMKNHQTIHLNQKLFACSLCTKKYTNQGNLDRHIRVFHHNEKQYQCNVCQKCFSQSSILRAHLHVHNEERNYECNVCHQRYKTVDYLNSHKKRHLPPEQRNFKKYPKKKSTSPVKKSFVCTLCGKKSNSVALHKSHTRIHTGEKPYSCSHCQKKFAFKQSLRSHILVHTGSKPYTCNICFAQFRQIGHLNGHSLVHSGEKKHKCLVCDKSFALRGNLTVHERLHTGETPYHCVHCPKKFYDSNGLKRHNQIHERNKSNNGSAVQETESGSMITELSDIILTEEGVDSGQSDHMEPKILIDSNGQHYKIEMPPEGEPEVAGKIDAANFYKMNYVDATDTTIWVSENN